MKQATVTRSQFRYNKKQVMFLTKMNDEQYSNFQIDTAKAWVETFWNGIIDVEALLNTTCFWQWWMYEWNYADDKQIISLLYRTHKLKRLTRYRELHQYCFDADNVQQQIMMVDFRHMRKDFERAIKQPSLL